MTTTDSAPILDDAPSGTQPLTTGGAVPAPSTPSAVTAQAPGARRPVAAPAAAPVSVVLALALLAAGAVLIRDALVSWNMIAGSLWTTPALTAFDGLSAQSWMLYAGIAVAVLGLILVVIAIKPRRRRGVSLGTSGAVWVRTGDLRAIARDAASDVSGVTGVKVSASRRSVRLLVTTTTADTAPVAASVTKVVTAALAPLDPPPAVRVRARTVEVS